MMFPKISRKKLLAMERSDSLHSTALPLTSSRTPPFTSINPFESINPKAKADNATASIPATQQFEVLRSNHSPPHGQSQCRLLSLPAEIRNQIYTEAFSTESTSRHALSLLETCRLVHTEATVLAFATVTFVTTRSDHYSLTQSTSPLPRAQFSAIAHLAFAAHCNYNSIYKLANFVANAAFHFPGIRSITLLAQRPETNGNTQVGTDDWFMKMLQLFVGGRPLAWSKDRPWTVKFADERPKSDQWGLWYITREEEEHWMQCVVSQDGEGGVPGKRVEVRTTFVEAYQTRRKTDFIPWPEPSERLPVTVLGEADRPTGIQWDGSPEWWVNKRRAQKKGLLARHIPCFPAIYGIDNSDRQP